MCLVSFLGEICHVSCVIPWGDLSCVSCHFMGRSTSDMCLMSFHGEICHVYCVILWEILCLICHVMCLVSVHGEICHVPHVILWGDLRQICPVFYVIALDLPSLVTSQTSKGHVLTYLIASAVGEWNSLKIMI